MITWSMNRKANLEEDIETGGDRKTAWSIFWVTVQEAVESCILSRG